MCVESTHTACQEKRDVTMMTELVPSGAYVIDDFLPVDRCQELIELACERGFEEAAVGTSRHTVRMEHLRNNDRLIWDHPGWAASLWERLAPQVPQEHFGLVPVGLNERLRFYRYEPGHKFDWHADGSFRRDNGERSVYTVLLYLNGGFGGGETLFEGTKVTPEAGLLCFFLHRLRHKGAEVTEGTKYVLRSDVMYGPA